MESNVKIKLATSLALGVLVWLAFLSPAPRAGSHCGRP
jgi:hypothetical protein